MTDIISLGESFEGAAFVPKIGDKVEFLSDRQTEKGPSSGTVLAVDRDTKTATIRHSDHPGETFRWSDVSARRFTIAHDGRPLWQLT
jgi:hypothetical protein